MNISDNERFHELAHKALAKQATAAELREMRTLIAENPKLKAEMEQMGGEAAVLREILPLLEDLNHPVQGIPSPPMALLRKEVREVFKASSKSKGELRELLGKLEDWAGKQAGAGREEVAALVAFLRGALLERESEASVAETAMLRVPEMGYAAPRLKEEVAGRAREAAASREAELVRRIRLLEGRMSEAEEIIRACRDEVRGLLELLASERSTSVERRGRSLIHAFRSMTPMPFQTTRNHDGGNEGSIPFTRSTSPKWFSPTS